MVEEEQFKNYCVIKTFGLKRADVAPYLKTGSVSVDYSEDCLDGTILVLNKDADEVEFHNTLDAITRAFGDKIYADCDCSLARRFVDVCREKGIKAVVAESLTGGMICSSIVDISPAVSLDTAPYVSKVDSLTCRRLTFAALV